MWSHPRCKRKSGRPRHNVTYGWFLWSCWLHTSTLLSESEKCLSRTCLTISVPLSTVQIYLTDHVLLLQFYWVSCYTFNINDDVSQILNSRRTKGALRLHERKTLQNFHNIYQVVFMLFKSFTVYENVIKYTNTASWDIERKPCSLMLELLQGH